MHASMERQRPTWCSTSMAAGRSGLHSPTSTTGRNAHACRPCTDITESAMQKACLVQHIHGLQVGRAGVLPLPELGIRLVEQVQHDLVAGGGVRDDVLQHLPPPRHPLPRHRLGGVIRVELIVQQHVEAVGSEVAHLRQSQPDI